MRQRQDFIRAHLETFGMIRRQEIVDRFEVTIAVASADLQTFIAEHPDAIDYDRGVKRYVYEGKAPIAAAAPKAASDTGAGLLREAANLVYRIEAAGRLEDEGINFDRWKQTARKLAPTLRAVLNTPIYATVKATTLEADLRKAIGEAIDGFKDGQLHSEKIDAILTALLKRIYHTGSDAGRLIGRLDVERACEMAAQVADREQRYEGSDFPVCAGIAREIRLIPAKMWAEYDGKDSSNAG
jgi:hypothetical protein